MAQPTTAVAPRKSPLPEVLEAQLKGLMPQIPVLLPPDIAPEQFRAALWLELSGRPSLLECSPTSLRECTVKAATYGLLPGRDCHFLPFKTKDGGGTKTATYVPNYHGILLALERSGKVRRAFAHVVHEGDEWSFDMFADRPIHRPAVTRGRQPGKELFYYGAVMFKDGTCAFEVVSLEDLDAIRRRAPAHESGPWVTDTVMMTRKSALKRVAKYVRLTPQQRAMLDDDDAREREDIPAERHAKNLTDVFGDGEGSGGYVQQQDTTQEPREGGKEARSGSQASPLSPDAPHGRTGHPGVSHAPLRQGGAWDTLRQYQGDARLEEAILERIAAALSSLAPATDTEALVLAGQVLDALDADGRGGAGPRSATRA
jgi:recombination protein RecT